MSSPRSLSPENRRWAIDLSLRLIGGGAGLAMLIYALGRNAEQLDALDKRVERIETLLIEASIRPRPSS